MTRTAGRIFKVLDRHTKAYIRDRVAAEFARGADSPRASKRFAAAALVHYLQTGGHWWRSITMMFECRYEYGHLHYDHETNTYTKRVVPTNGHIIIRSTPLDAVRDFWRWADNRSKAIPETFHQWWAVKITVWEPWAVSAAGNLEHGGRQGVAYFYEWKYDWPMADLQRKHDSK